MVGARLLGLEGEVTRRVGHGAPCLSDFRLYLFVAPSGEQLALPMMCWRGTSLSIISRVFVPVFLFGGQSVVVDVEGVGFSLRAVVAGR